MKLSVLTDTTKIEAVLPSLLICFSLWNLFTLCYNILFGYICYTKFDGINFEGSGIIQKKFLLYSLNFQIIIIIWKEMCWKTVVWKFCVYFVYFLCLFQWGPLLVFEFECLLC